ncbi:hypothetical protein BH11PSE13_BH11PSE13_21400 [soil metagenome]
MTAQSTTTHALSRRTVLGALTLPWLVGGIGGCTTPLPLVQAPANDAAAAARLRDSAEAHGLAAYRQFTDINVSYSGKWRPLVNRIQPEVVDEGYRGSSQERLLPSTAVVAQAYTGPMGRKHVWWRRGGTASDDKGEVAVWFNGVRSGDDDKQQAAALVAEGYGLFLLGPLWLNDRGLRMQMGGTERVDGRICDVVDVWLSPGLGRVANDRVALCIDRVDGLVHRMRFTLEGFANTQGAVAEVDTFEHERRFGVMWPMRSFERIVHPIALPAHDWRITGLDVNRGYEAREVTGPAFTGRAAAPATPV